MILTMVSKWFLHIAANSSPSVLELENTDFETHGLQDVFQRMRLRLLEVVAPVDRVEPGV